MKVKSDWNLDNNKVCDEYYYTKDNNDWSKLIKKWKDYKDDDNYSGYKDSTDLEEDRKELTRRETNLKKKEEVLQERIEKLEKQIKEHKEAVKEFEESKRIFEERKKEFDKKEWEKSEIKELIE